ncbi:MAG: glycosyltransferase family 4 protein [Planctomycetota bacterium]
MIPRILYHHRTAAEDGQAVHIRSMLRAFAAEGAEVQEVGLVKRSVDAPPRASQEEDGKGGFGLMELLPRFLRETAEYAYTGLARSRVLAVGRSFRPHFVYERYAFGNAGGLAAAKRLRVPFFLEVNSPLVDELARTRGLSFPRLARRVERHVLAGSDRVCAVTGVLRDLLVELGAVRERIFVTPNGVDVELYADPTDAEARGAARRDLGIAELDDGAVVLGFVGYYRSWHRLELVLRAMAEPELSRAHLVLVGEGPARAELEAESERLQLDARVHFVGPRRHDEVPRLLAAFDVGLVPAINAYASPLKLHEYMAAGLPTVAPDQPNLREVLVHERESLLFPPGDERALSESLRRLVRDGELRTRLGTEARRRIDAQGLTWRANARRVLEEAASAGAFA